MPITARGTATLPAMTARATTDITVTWNKPLPDTSYSLLLSLPTALLGKLNWTATAQATDTATLHITASADHNGGAVNALAFKV
jgi:hypothetical protein